MVPLNEVNDEKFMLGVNKFHACDHNLLIPFCAIFICYVKTRTRLRHHLASREQGRGLNMTTQHLLGPCLFQYSGSGTCGTASLGW